MIVWVFLVLPCPTSSIDLKNANKPLRKCQRRSFNTINLEFCKIFLAQVILVQEWNKVYSTIFPIKS